MAKDRLQECGGIIKHSEKQGTADFASRISMQSMRNHERELLQARIQELEAELAKYKLKYTKDKPTEPGWYWWGVFRSVCNTSYFDEKIIRIVEDSKGFIKEEYHCSLDEMPGYFAGPIGPIPEPEQEDD